MIGRREQLEEVVTQVLTGDRPIIVPGGPGMGKTTLAVAAAHDKRVAARFGAQRVFIDLQAVTSADAILRALASELRVDITGSAANILDNLAAGTTGVPTLAILDNLETPWHAEEEKTEQLIGHLADVGGLRLILTVRGSTPVVPGGAHRLGDIARLGPDEARRLFLRVASDQFVGDPSLTALLAALEGHPLSIVLLAAQNDGRSDLAGLAKEWQTRKSAVLARGKANDRLTSVRVSLGLSLDRLGADAKRLLGLVAMLPAGLHDDDGIVLLPDAAADTASILVKARLVESRDGRLTMLAPLRETAREAGLSTAQDEARLIAHFLTVATNGGKIGRHDWQVVQNKVSREAGNLDAMCLLALRRSEADKREAGSLDHALFGLAELHRFGVPAEITTLRYASLQDRDARLKARCTAWLGSIALQRSDHTTARARYEEAMPLFARIGDMLGQANCIRSLGDIALDRSDHDTARTRLEEAKSLYERIGDQLGQANCIKSLGDVALASPGDGAETAHAHLQQAKALYERIGDILGQANCIESLGGIALRQKNHSIAHARYEEAKPLFERVGDLLGQANCIKGFGDVALDRNDLKTARAHFEEAKPLFENVGDLLGQANCIMSFGDIARAHPDHDTARARYKEALAILSKIPEPYSIGFAHFRLMQVAGDAADRSRHREAARTAWSCIGRRDLIEKHLDPPKKGSTRKKRSRK